MPNPYHDEVLALLRRADCHYGWALRDEEEGLSVEEAATKRDNVRIDRIAELRKAVHMVADGEHSVRHPRVVGCQAASVFGVVWRCAQALCSS